MTNQRHRRYWDKTEIMDKAATQALLKPDTEWTNQRHRQALRQGTQRMNKPEIQASIIEARHRMDKPETHAFLGQETEWTNQRHMQH